MYVNLKDLSDIADMFSKIQTLSLRLITSDYNALKGMDYEKATKYIATLLTIHLKIYGSILSEDNKNMSSEVSMQELPDRIEDMRKIHKEFNAMMDIFFNETH